jgi:hypothetical protein
VFEEVGDVAATVSERRSIEVGQDLEEDLVREGR